MHELSGQLDTFYLIHDQRISICAHYLFNYDIFGFFQTQPKTLLLSEIEPGNRYKLVCTIETGFVRYRMGDVINCTRFLTMAAHTIEATNKFKKKDFQLGCSTFTKRTNRNSSNTSCFNCVSCWKFIGCIR